MVMADARTPECPKCKRVAARVAQLEAIVVKLQARIEVLEAENARLRKDSSNSHKPPSSDIVKPSPPARRHGRKRRIGGQGPLERDVPPLLECGACMATVPKKGRQGCLVPWPGGRRPPR